ncbi:MAG: cytochrome b [Gammaproteobacteria bacterium]
MIRNTLTSYGVVAKFFHWTIAFLVVFMLVFGYFLDDFPESYKSNVYNLHKLTGLLILSLMLLRMCWALMNPKPILPHSPTWQLVAERVVHYALYVAAIGMPLAGWIGSCAAGRYPHVGDVKFILPIPQNKTIVDAAFNIHGLFAIALIVLISIHVLAALYHHFIKQDQILRRMLPSW